MENGKNIAYLVPGKSPVQRRLSEITTAVCIDLLLIGIGFVLLIFLFLFRQFVMAFEQEPYLMTLSPF